MRDHFSSLCWRALVILTLLYSHILLANNRLIFPFEKNNLLPMPIRFEYQLIDKENIKIGSFHFNALDIEAQFKPQSKKLENYDLFLRWPSQFARFGEVVIKDSGGKSIWSSRASAKNTKSRRRGKVRLSEMKVSENVNVLIESLRKIPFFKFCVLKDEPQARIYICSKDLFIKPRSNPIQIEARDSFRKESFVEINGKLVDEQGVLVLNDTQNFVSMRALLLSGATFEIETKLQTINFMDLYFDEESNKIFVTATGTPPIDAPDYKALGNGIWQASMNPDRPFLYVKGQGNIPLRQEFLVQGEIKRKNLKVDVLNPPEGTIFSDEVQLILQCHDSIKLEAGDDQTRIEKNQDGTYTWYWANLDRGKVNRRFLRIKYLDQVYNAYFEIKTDYDWAVQSRLAFPLWGQVRLDKIINSKIHAMLMYEKLVSKNENENDLDVIKLSFLRRSLNHFRIEPGMQYGGFLNRVVIEGEDALNLGAEFGMDYLLSHHFFASSKALVYFHTELTLASLSGSMKNKMSYQAEAGIRQIFDSQYYIEYGLNYRTFKFSYDAKDSGYTKALGFLSAGFVF